MADTAKLAEIAIREVGVREVGGNNCGPRVREYQAATWLEPGPWPWCAAFVAWCVREWLRNHVTADDPLLGGARASEWRPRTGGAFDLENWARKAKATLLGPKTSVRPGDLVVYDMSHCGIIVASAHAGSLFVEAVEGNTGLTGLRDSSAGDGVFRKKRDRKMVRSLIRLERAA